MEQGKLLVFKLDCAKHFSYCNDAFMEITGYFEEELLGQPYEMITHQDMPAALARKMWQQVQTDDEFLLYVKSCRKDGSVFWSLANLTQTYDSHGQASGYLSVRRHAPHQAVEFFQNLYLRMCQLENSETQTESALDESEELLEQAVSKKGGYDEFVCSFF